MYNETTENVKVRETPSNLFYENRNDSRNFRWEELNYWSAKKSYFWLKRVWYPGVYQYLKKKSFTGIVVEFIYSLKYC